MVLRLSVGLLFAGWFFAAPAHAQIPPEPLHPLVALQRASDSAIGIEVRALDGALSAQTLGQNRKGTGVVIGPLTGWC